MKTFLKIIVPPIASYILLFALVTVVPFLFKYGSMLFNHGPFSTAYFPNGDLFPAFYAWLALTVIQYGILFVAWLDEDSNNEYKLELKEIEGSTCDFCGATNSGQKWVRCSNRLIDICPNCNKKVCNLYIP